MNEVIVGGHLGVDPEVRFTSSGTKVTTLRVGARVRRGSKGEETIWWRVTIWGETFDKLIPYLKKGSAVIIFGDLSKPEIFTDKEGKPQVSMNITAHNIALSPFGRGENTSTTSQSGSQSLGGSSSFGKVDTSPSREAVKKGGKEKNTEQTEEEFEDLFSDEEIPF